jgi:hypothetical protein
MFTSPSPSMFKSTLTTTTKSTRTRAQLLESRPPRRVSAPVVDFVLVIGVALNIDGDGDVNLHEHRLTPGRHAFIHAHD